MYMQCNMRFRVCISQNDRTPLDIGQARWGGKIRERTRISITGKVCKGHEWTLYYKEAKKFIDEIYPHMIIPYKKQQVEKAIENVKKGISRRFKCPYCENDYASPSGLRRHVKSDHPENA